LLEVIGSLCKPCAFSSIPSQRNLRMSLTGSLDAFCLAEVSEGRRLRGVSCLFSLLLICNTGLNTAASFLRQLVGVQTSFTSWTCVTISLRAVQHSAEYLRLTAWGPMFIIGAHFRALA
jgi:hypothetical protein